MSPGKIIWADQSDQLNRLGYWGSYNRAFYPEIQELTGQNEKAAEFGDWFTHNKTNR